MRWHRSQQKRFWKRRQTTTKGYPKRKVNRQHYFIPYRATLRRRVTAAVTGDPNGQATQATI